MKRGRRQAISMKQSLQSFPSCPKSKPKGCLQSVKPCDLGLLFQRDKLSLMQSEMAFGRYKKKGGKLKAWVRRKSCNWFLPKVFAVSVN